MPNKRRSDFALPANLDDLPPEDLRAILREWKMVRERPHNVADLWDSNDFASYWILLISGTHRHEQLQIASEVLTWSAFTTRGSSRVLCLQHSDEEAFNLCTKYFVATEFPALFLATSPEMSTYVGLPKAVIQQLFAVSGGLQDFLSETHSALVRGESLGDINKRLIKDKAFHLAGVLYREVRGIVSFKASADIQGKF